jgi:tRNA threonylcarbamoyladenosine biosynthesis protein TsaB
MNAAPSPLKEGTALLLLAFETSAKAAGAALFDENKLLAECYQNTGMTHSQTLLVMAEDLLKQIGKTAADVTAVAVAAGPGSFTGVRIGVAAAKGFAWAKELPCYGVSTLEAMALSLGIFEGTVCACMDARRAQVYNALFSFRNGQICRISDDRAISIADLSAELQNIDGPVYLVGDGAELVKRTLSDLPNLILPAEHRRHQRATGVGLAALAQIAAGMDADANALTPNYLRLSQAERERLEKSKDNQ